MKPGDRVEVIGNTYNGGSGTDHTGRQGTIKYMRTHAQGPGADISFDGGREPEHFFLESELKVIGDEMPDKEAEWDPDAFVQSNRFFFLPGDAATKKSFTSKWKELEEIKPWYWHSAAFVIANKYDDPERFKELVGKFFLILAFNMSGGKPILCGWGNRPNRRINVSRGLTENLIEKPEEFLLHLQAIAEPKNWGILAKVSDKERDHSTLAIMKKRIKEATHIAMLGPFELSPEP